jgi:hypothetical protein
VPRARGKCEIEHTSGRCKIFVAQAGDGARCVVSVELRSGRVVTFDAEYGRADGCMTCGTSTLRDEDVEQLAASQR